MEGANALSEIDNSPLPSKKRRAATAPEPTPTPPENGARGRRQRKQPAKFDFDYLDNEVQREIQQAIKISKLETKRVEKQVEECPVYYPTAEQFKDPIAFITNIRAEAERFGICKIVPPSEWKMSLQFSMIHPLKFATKKQRVNLLQQGKAFKDGKHFDIASYQQMADAFEEQWMSRKHGTEFAHLPTAGAAAAAGVHNKGTVAEREEVLRDKYAALVKDYWGVVELNTDEVTVEYGNDINTAKYGSGFPSRKSGRVSGSGKVENLCKTSSNASSPGKSDPSSFNNAEKVSPPDGQSRVNPVKEEPPINGPGSSMKQELGTEKGFDQEYYESSGWNLNNIPSAPGSLLQHLKTPVNGVNVPWLYVGMLFASFCWHNEDNYFYSINYNHYGAGKQWYGIPGTSADIFEKVAKDFLHSLFRDSPDLLHHMTLQISPSLLLSHGVPVYKTVQQAGTFIVTFPKAYHAGFGLGFNVGEAVNFATLDWLPRGGEAEERYRTFARGSVFSHHRLLFTLLHHVQSINDTESRAELVKSILAVLDEELAGREQVLRLGVKDISSVVTLPKNNFEVINKQAIDYDDMRLCSVCKHACVFTAVACECNQQKVACYRHVSMVCRCSKDRKYVLEWGSSTLLAAIRAEVAKLTSPSSLAGGDRTDSIPAAAEAAVSPENSGAA